MARAVAAVCSMGRFIFLCGSPDQDAALHDNIPARWITRRDPERVCEAILRQAGLWIASRSPSPRVHSRDPLARNDDLKYVA